MADLLTEYRAGHEAEVWNHLAAIDLRELDPARLQVASSVCEEGARRARQNVETLVGRLTAQGYRFHSNDYRQEPMKPFVPPGPQAGVVIDWLDGQFAPLPLMLVSWMRWVGDAWLVGTHPEWQESSSADPLVIQAEGSHFPDSSIVDYFEEELEMWGEAGLDEPFVLPLAPDQLHKSNTSGGDPYGVVLPSYSVDAAFVGEQSVPLVEYLNDVFSHGGFPGPTDGAGHEIRRSLASGMLRI